MKKSRQEIVEFILDLEHRFNVEEWQINGVDIWPALRNALFGRLVNVYEYEFTTGNANSGNPSQVQNFGKFERLFYYLKNRSKFKKASNLLLSTAEYRETIAGLSRNKFYEYFLTQNKLNGQSLILEYGKKVDVPYSHDAKIILFNKFFEGFKLYQKLSRKRTKFNASSFLSGYDDFVTHVERTFPANEIQELLDLGYQKFVFKAIRELSDFLKAHLSNRKLNSILAVCYYNHHITYAGMVCGNELGVKAIDVQHGPANKHHMCYSLWGNNRKLYNSLPSEFWLWDEITYNNLNWLRTDDRYTHRITGQPWMKFVETLPTDLNISGYVLYTLQCDPHTLDELFSPQIIKLIRASQKPWVVRRHPRQQQSIDQILNFIQTNYGQLDNLFLKEYEHYSLPVLLAKCDMHFTFSSGSAIEASFFKKPSIAVGPVAPLYFKDYIDAGVMNYIPHDSEDFIEKAHEEFKNLVA